MRKHHPQNIRIKRRYLAYLEEARRLNASTVDQVAAAIDLFQASTGHRDFKAFHIEQARKFRRQLHEAVVGTTGKPLAQATIHARLMAVKGFFVWLAGQPGYRSRLTYSDADYFNPSASESRIARAVRERPSPTIEQIQSVLKAMPALTDIQRRDRALIAFVLLSGARDNAIASLSIKHVDLMQRTVFQDAREVRTKNAKTFTSSFFPVGPEVEAIVVQWVAFLTEQKLFGGNDPLFPATRVEVGPDGLYRAAGLDRRHWKDAGAIRRVFREAFVAAGLPYFHPHSLRRTLALLGQRTNLSHEEMKAWSQNLGHSDMMTTLTSYGTISAARQREILDNLATGQPRRSQAGLLLDPATVSRLLEKFGIE
jgi:integrase